MQTSIKKAFTKTSARPSDGLTTEGGWVGVYMFGSIQLMEIGAFSKSKWKAPISTTKGGRSGASIINTTEGLALFWVTDSLMNSTTCLYEGKWYPSDAQVHLDVLRHTILDRGVRCGSIIHGLGGHTFQMHRNESSRFWTCEVDWLLFEYFSRSAFTAEAR